MNQYDAHSARGELEDIVRERDLRRLINWWDTYIHQVYASYTVDHWEWLAAKDRGWAEDYAQAHSLTLLADEICKSSLIIKQNLRKWDATEFRRSVYLFGVRR